MLSARGQRPTGAAQAAAAMMALLWVCPTTMAEESDDESGVRSLAVVDISSDEKANAEIARDVVRAVRKHSDYELKDTHVALNAGAEVEAQNNIRTAMAFLQAGAAALEGGDHEEAYDQLASARRMIERDFAVLRDPDDYRATLMNLAVAMLRSGERDAAQEVFERAIIFRAKVDTLELSDAEHEVLVLAQEAVANRPLGAVAIETVPEHAEVYVDGRYRGISPATVAGLPAGEHLVTVYKAGHARHTRTMTASDEALGVTSIEMDGARRQLQYNQLIERLRSELSELSEDNISGGEGVKSVGALFYSELALVVHVTGEADTKTVDLALFHVASKRLLNRLNQSVDWSFRNKDAIAGLVNTLLDIDFAAAMGGAIAPARMGSGSRDSALTSWWLWTIVGAVVAGGVTAAVVATLPEDAPPPPTGGTLVVQF
jgi:tetratricopeptide (TPR) repeat protein